MQEPNYKADLLRDLADPAYAATYLSAALDDSAQAFLIALRDVAEAQNGVSRIAEAAGVNRENLYRILSGEGNPRFDTLRAVLQAMGFQMRFSMERPEKRKKRSRVRRLSHGVRISTARKVRR